MSSFLNGALRIAQNAEKAKPTVDCVFALDVSGSMAAVDAIDRSKFVPKAPPARQPMIRRIDAAIADIVTHYKSISPDRRGTVRLITFGEDVKVHPDILNLGGLEEALAPYRLEKNLERATATHTMLKKVNEMYREFLAKPHADGSTFVNIVYTDGAPSAHGRTLDQLQEEICNTIAEGSCDMPSDDSRGLTFIQYGVREYAKESTVSQFLSFLDDNLTNYMVAMARKAHPEVSDDDLGQWVYDYVDYVQQCTTWEDKVPGHCGTQDPKEPCDGDVNVLFDLAVSD